MKSKILELRALVGELHPFKRESLPFSLLEGGIPCSALTEVAGVAGSGKTQWVCQLIQENPVCHIAWVESNFSVYPCFFDQAGISLDRILFVEGQGKEEQIDWSILQSLSSGLFKIVIRQGKIGNIKNLRRLQLAAERAGSSVILLTEKLTQQMNWPISLQVRVRKIQGKVSSQVIKDRRWVLQKPLQKIG